MNDSELARHLTEAVDSLQRVLALIETVDERDGMTLLARYKDSYNGWPPSSGFDRSARQSSDRDGEPISLHSDPTGEAATRPDRARDDRRQLERDILAAGRLARSITDNADHYVLRDANATERQSTDGEQDRGCVSCARIRGPRTPTWWNPIARGLYCRWCSDYQRATGKLPTIADLEAHRDGRKVRRSA